MSPGKAMRITLDLVCALLLTTLTVVPVALAAFWHRHTRKKEGTLLHISGASSTHAILEKFDSLDFLFHYDGTATEGVFTGNVMFWYPSKNSLLMRFGGGWVVAEQRKILGHMAVTGAVLSILRLSRLTLTEHAIAIRGWDPYFSGLAAWAMAFLFDLPWCISIHADYGKRESLQGGVIPTAFGSSMFSGVVEKFVCRRADLLLPIRESMVPRLIEIGCPRERIALFPHGINVSSYLEISDNGRKEKFLNIGGARRILSMVGRFEKENYIYDYLRIADKLSSLRKDWVLIMAGGGTEYDQFRELVRERKLEAHVSLCGFISHEDSIALRQASFIGLCLMGGFSLIETLASACPAIAYDVEWHGELVRNGKTGYLVPEGNTDRVVERIVELLGSPEKALRMRAPARELAFERHRLEVVSKVKRACYKELVR